jgi:hypothetical protein
MIRLPFYSLLVLVSLSIFASADLKIKSRTTVAGHTSESTVYIKGPRERNEMSFGGHGGAVTITQCDQKRMITIAGNQCMIMPMGGGESSCPAINMQALARGAAEGEPTPPRKGGVVTITRTSTDTGERQDMFGFKARHIKSSVVMESSPDACNQSHMKMEMDGWYADLSAGFSCADDSYQSMACAGGKRGCSDRIVVKGGGGGAPLGYPLKQTISVTSEHGNFTTTTEVLELTNTSLDAPLFDMPSGCRVMDMSAMMGGAPATTPTTAAPETPAAASPAAAAPAAQPAAPTAPAMAPKAAGVVRIGVVKIKDASGESLPIDNLRLNLLSELAHQQLEAIPLDAEAPQTAVESEARSKECDYVLYTVSTQVKEPGNGGISPGALPKGVTLDPAKFQAVTGVTLYKVGKPQPELKDLLLAADANSFAVDAVTATFVQESSRVSQQITDDAHPKAASKTAKTPAKPGTAATKSK